MTSFNLLPLLPIFVGAMLVVLAVNYLARKDLDYKEPQCKDCRHHIRGQYASLCTLKGTIADPKETNCPDFQHPKP